MCNYNKPQAIAIINGADKTKNIVGTVKFYQKGSCVLVMANIKGLSDTATGFLGFHIHEGADCYGMHFSNSKSHYNPKNMRHPMHAGDLPPLLVCGTMAHLSVLTDRFNITDIIGRTVVIHNMVDDFTTQPSGNSGEKIACGVINQTAYL